MSNFDKLTIKPTVQTENIIFYVDGSISRNGKIIAVEPTYDQKAWVLRRLKGNSRSWQRWFEGLYFTNEQKTALGLNKLDMMLLERSRTN